MIGKNASQPSLPTFYLDESLVPTLADALRLFQYDISNVFEVFGQGGIQDPEIIEWVEKHNAIWIEVPSKSV